MFGRFLLSAGPKDPVCSAAKLEKEVPHVVRAWRVCVEGVHAKIRVGSVFAEEGKLRGGRQAVFVRARS